MYFWEDVGLVLPKLGCFILIEEILFITPCSSFSSTSSQSLLSNSSISGEWLNISVRKLLFEVIFSFSFFALLAFFKYSNFVKY